MSYQHIELNLEIIKFLLKTDQNAKILSEVLYAFDWFLKFQMHYEKCAQI